MTQQMQKTLIDGSRLMIEAIVQAGADVFVGYPITPANLLFQYASRRFPRMMGAPDEISTLQWMSGAAATGLIPVTATSFPGLALMVESINMAYMMELPMVIILAQRLGPSTGTATCGAQGDIAMVHGMISGGFPVPTLCVSSLRDCWDVSAEAVRMAVSLRSPVILMTSKEQVMTLQDVDLATLAPVRKVALAVYDGTDPYVPYKPDQRDVPSFLPLGNPLHQVRFTASTHDESGRIQHTTAVALANSRRLQEKLLKNLDEFTHYDLDEEEGATRLIVAFDVTAGAARQALIRLRRQGHAMSLLVPKTLFPVPDRYLEIMAKYDRVVLAEENLTGQYAEILFGRRLPTRIRSLRSFGGLIPPEKIMQEVIS